jgi:hypothetical protein
MLSYGRPRRDGDVALVTNLVVDDASGPALPDDSSPTASGHELRAIGTAAPDPDQDSNLSRESASET